jgi:manganese/zinc/iron transport system permease protein
MISKSLSDRQVWVVIALAVLLLLAVPAIAIAAGVSFFYTLRTVTLGAMLLGAISGSVGGFAVLRKQSLLGDALSHAALPGVGIAFLVAGRELWALLLGAAAASFLGVWFVGVVTRNTRLKQDTAMGIVLAGWFALGIGVLTFIQQRPDASQAGLDTFIFGQAAAIVASDVRLLAALGGVTVLALLANWKQFKLVTFDPEFARANGHRVGATTAVLLFLVVIAIVIGLQLAGVVLMVGLLIAPGIAARQWTNTLGQMVTLAAVFGAVAGSSGAILSGLDTDLPTGPMIIVTATILVVLSLLFAPGRGVVWGGRRRRADRKRFSASLPAGGRDVLD